VSTVFEGEASIRVISAPDHSVVKVGAQTIDKTDQKLDRGDM